MTHDQSTVLVVYLTLLSELHTASKKNPADDWEVTTNLVFDDSISEIFREFTHCASVGIVFLVVSRTGALGQGP